MREKEQFSEEKKIGSAVTKKLRTKYQNEFTVIPRVIFLFLILRRM